MKKTIITCAVLLIVIVGGVYLAQRSTPADAPDPGTSAATTTDTAPGMGRGTAVIPEEGTVTLGLHETAAFRGVLITPSAVVEDSRCPAGVYCIQAGTLHLDLDINSSLGTTTKTVRLGDSVTLGNEKFTFSSVDPLKTQAPITESQYRFTVTVEKLK